MLDTELKFAVTPTKDKIKVLLLYIVYPLAMGTYFKRALERRDDVDLKVTGIYTGNWMPWLGGMEVPMKYAIPPHIPLPFRPDIQEVNYDLVKAQLGDWIPDIVINCDAGLHWKYKPSDGFVATVGTDPHVLNEFYEVPRKYSDAFFNMQKVYSRSGDIYLPYAYDPTVHYPIDGTVGVQPHDTMSNPLESVEYVRKDTDCVLGGMPYEQRVQWIAELRKRGCSVLFENGPIMDEYRLMNNRARIGLNWSSLDDLNARAFELAAMKLAPVMNVVTDLDASGIECATFTNLNEAVDAAMYLKEHDDKRIELANDAYRSVQGQTYDARISQILKVAGFE
jgi:glycosyl transferase family 1